MTQIRDADIADATGIAEVHVQTWQSTYAGVLPDEYLVGLSVSRHAVMWHKSLSSRRLEQHVAVAVGEDGDVVGFASCGRLRDRSQVGGEGQAGEIFTLYVLPDFQDLGLGRGLLTRSFAGLAGDGCDSAIIWVLEANPSRFFYEAMGGRKVSGRQENFAGTRVSELAYCWDSLVVTQERLGTGRG
ncbi:MAG: GNAT family N-acetyltransferase [Alphaproteobacteria bacterium]